MKVLITDEVHPLLPEQLSAMGYTVTYLPAISYAETLAMIADYEGLVVNSKILCSAPLLDQAPKLRWISRLGSGMEVIDTQECDKRGVRYFNSPEGNSNAVAEHALGLLLSLLNNIVRSDKEVKQGQWIREPNRGTELSGKTVGIIAYGHTGRAFARVLGGFDVQILAYDKYLSGFGTDRVREASLPEIFEQADILSLHLPLTTETTYMIDAAFLSNFRKPIYLINTSRGKVLQTTAVIEALQTGAIKGAALDVLENEKLHDLKPAEKEWFDTLIKNDRVILTPHIAGWTHESKKRIAEVVIEKLKALSH